MNDDEKSKALPTRHSDSRPDGGAMGASQERQMRGSVPDTNSFNTRFRTNADGSTTRLRTRGGMCEYVTEQLPVSYGTTCKLDMDSGVVDLLDASLLGTEDHDNSSGILYRTQYVQEVVDGPVGGITGPVIGEIKPPGTAGVAPDDGLPAESFIATDIDSPYEKKRMAVLVPPSVFTGKMRQYVQALYGRHDHAEMLQLPPGVGAGSAPMLYMDWTKQFGTEENPITGSVVVIDTNCGIHTDTTTGEHTLFCINTSQVNIYKLNPGACAKKLRSVMLDQTTPNGDKMRIESYILSESKPDITSKVTLDIGGYAPRYSFGYGWHFNYAGTCCDMVDTIVGYSGENVSTHYRLTFSKDAFGAWSVEYEIVEGPVQWKNYRHAHVIGFPVWDYSGFYKVGVTNAMAPYGNAPFYAFYVKDSVSESGTGDFSQTVGSTLKTCRYNTGEYTSPRGADRYPAYMNPGNTYTFGSDYMDYKYWDDHTRRSVSVSCGETTIVGEHATYSKAARYHSSPSPDFGAAGSGAVWFSGDIEAPICQNVNTGQGVPENCSQSPIYDYYEGTITVCGMVEGQANYGPYDQEEICVTNGRLFASTTSFPANWTSEDFTQHILDSTAFIIVSPFLDSESLYMLNSQSQQRTETGNAYAKHGGRFFAGHGTRTYIGGPVSPVTSYAILGPDYGTNISSSTFTDRDGGTDTTTTKLVVSNYGVDADVAVIPTPGAFFNSYYDVVPVVATHRSSSSGKAIHSDELGVDKGLGTTTIDNKPFSFVGWA